MLRFGVVHNYILKIYAGASKLLRDAATDVSSRNKGIKEKFRKIANVFLNSNLMSAQVAAYHLLSLPLSKMSRRCIFINISLIKERVSTKSDKLLNKMEKESTDIYMPDIFQKYSSRAHTLENVCLADYAELYSKINKTKNDDSYDEEIFESRKFPAILRYRQYKLTKDENNYYREQLLLFHPWRNELSEVGNVIIIIHKPVYDAVFHVIESNRQNYSVLGDEVLDSAMSEVQSQYEDLIHEEEEDFIADRPPPEQQIDIFQQKGTALP